MRSGGGTHGRGRDSVSSNHTLTTLSDTVRSTKKSSTPVTSDTTVEKGGSDKRIKTSNRNLTKGKESDPVSESFRSY